MQDPLTFRRRRRNRRPTYLPVLLALLIAAQLAAYWWLSSTKREAVDSPTTIPVREAQRTRPVYPYSVIRGGVYSAKELKTALSLDTIAALHYVDFRTAEAHPVVLEKERLAYVSYRSGNSIYWTRHPVRLVKGETLITDGEHLARARCGNRISETPQEPVSSREPEPSRLDTPEPPPQKIADAALIPIPALDLTALFAAPDLVSLAVANLPAGSEPLPNPSSFLLGASLPGGLMPWSKSPAPGPLAPIPDAPAAPVTVPGPARDSSRSAWPRTCFRPSLPARRRAMRHCRLRIQPTLSSLREDRASPTCCRTDPRRDRRRLLALARMPAPAG